MPPVVRTPSVVHLLERPGDDRALCGYQKAQLDIVKAYIDPAGQRCEPCERAAAEREASEPARG